MFACICIFGILLWSASGQLNLPPNVTTCEEFERGAKFDPYAMIDSLWKIFYFWANHSELYPIMFSLPARKRLLKMKELLDSIEPNLDIEWDKATLIMAPRPGTEVLFLYLGTPGAFRALVIKEQRDKGSYNMPDSGYAEMRPYREPITSVFNMGLKLLSGIRYLAMMDCDRRVAYLFARVEDMPQTEEGCEKAANMSGYHGPDGHCYLELFKPPREKDEL